MRIEKVLTRSTAVIPQAQEVFAACDFGGIRAVPFEHGWILWTKTASSDSDLPEWLRPTWREAVRLDCELILLDRDV